MIRILIVFAVAILGQAASDKEAGYLLAGGVDADISEVPYQASIIYQNNHTCGGSIISKSYILTAAHCFPPNVPKDPKDYTVRVGSTYLNKEGIILQIAKITVHPKFNYSAGNYDFALLQLETPIEEFGAKIKSIPLASPDQRLVHESTAEVSGWGRLNEEDIFSERLHKAGIKLLDLKDCIESFEMHIKLTDLLLCTHTTGTGYCLG
jgi:secreted trypsin-like serine protease